MQASVTHAKHRVQMKLRDKDAPENSVKFSLTLHRFLFPPSSLYQQVAVSLCIKKRGHRHIHNFVQK